MVARARRGRRMAARRGRARGSRARALAFDPRRDLRPAHAFDGELRTIVLLEARHESVAIQIRLELHGERRRSVHAGAMHVDARYAGEGLDAVLEGDELRERTHALEDELDLTLVLGERVR